MNKVAIWYLFSSVVTFVFYIQDVSMKEQNHILFKEPKLQPNGSIALLALVFLVVGVAKFLEPAPKRAE